MSSSFGKKKPVVRQNEQTQVLAWLPRTKPSDAGSLAAQESLQAFYRITHTEPSRLERARMMRGQHRTAA